MRRACSGRSYVARIEDGNVEVRTLDPGTEAVTASFTSRNPLKRSLLSRGRRRYLTYKFSDAGDGWFESDTENKEVNAISAYFTFHTVQFSTA